jgi:hypothetical protein
MSAHGSTHPYECLVEISCCFIVASGFGLQQKTSLSRTPVCGPLHSDACLHAPAPPPAGCFHCQQVSYVSVREEGPGECIFRASERECRQNRANFNTPSKSQTFDHSEKMSARGISPSHAPMVKFSCFLILGQRFGQGLGQTGKGMGTVPQRCLI